MTRTNFLCFVAFALVGACFGQGMNLKFSRIFFLVMSSLLLFKNQFYNNLLLFIVNTFFGIECFNACDLKLRTCNYVDYPVYPVGLNVSSNEQMANGMISL